MNDQLVSDARRAANMLNTLENPTSGETLAASLLARLADRINSMETAMEPVVENVLAWSKMPGIAAIAVDEDNPDPILTLGDLRAIRTAYFGSPALERRARAEAWIGQYGLPDQDVIDRAVGRMMEEMTDIINRRGPEGQRQLLRGAGDSAPDDELKEMVSAYFQTMEERIRERGAVAQIEALLVHGRSEEELSIELQDDPSPSPFG